jgi:valyl-tRNA synthetase
LPSNQKVPFYLVPSGLVSSERPFTDEPKAVLPTGLVDPAVEKDRLTKELSKVEKDLEQTRRKLGDPNMLAKAPPAKLEEWRALEASLAEKDRSLRESLAKLQG